MINCIINSWNLMFVLKSVVEILDPEAQSKVGYSTYSKSETATLQHCAK